MGKMSGSVRTSSPQLVRRAIDLNYENRKRASSLRWSAFNSVLLIVFAYDLSCKCPGYTSFLHYVELGVASVLCANLLQHAFQLLPRRSRDAVLTLTPAQQQLLGLADTDLDSSFRVVDGASASRAGDASGVSASAAGADDELNVSLSPRRAWRSPGDASPPTPHSPHRSPSPPAAATPNHYREPRDEFIADRHSLSDYLRQYEERSRLASPAEAGSGGAPRAPRPAPYYQLALSQKESGEQEESGGGGGGGGGGAGAGSPRVWWRVHLEPEHLTQFNLNLRLWLQVTILSRLVREVDALDAAFAKHGLSTLKIGEVSVERLRKLSARGAGAEGGGGALAGVLPFLEPFPDQRYAVQRIRELSRGGCLSEYRWCGGGSGWDESKPTDAELVLALLAAYLDGQLPAPPARPFSARHLSAAPAAPPAGPDALAIHRVRARPPHYALALADETLEVARGRNNLLHTVLLFVAAACAARHRRRMHLGPAGLNMLWIIGR